MRLITADSFKDIKTPSKVETKTLDVEVVYDDPNETDAQVMDRLRNRFQILEKMTKSCKAGKVRAMIVTGGPGTGKSYSIEKVLHRHDVFATIAQDEKLKKYEVVKGAMSALGLYAKLYAYRSEKNILVFDDCDSIFFDDTSLNILKAALDSGKTRTISWNTDSRLLEREDIPKSFEFKGGVIFITNIKFQNVRSKKLKEHLDALESRCHYIDLTIDTTRDKLLRMKMIVDEGMLDGYDLTDNEKDEIMQFVYDKKDVLRELSLRMVLKIADLRQSFSEDWKDIASLTCVRER